ncbi:MAG TPA: hypothetical protein VGE21_02300 [Flavobacteriales bacterium]
MSDQENIPKEDRTVEDGHVKSTDSTAARGMLGIIFILLIVCSIIAAVIYAAAREDVPHEDTRIEEVHDPAQN